MIWLQGNSQRHCWNVCIPSSKLMHRSQVETLDFACHVEKGLQLELFVVGDRAAGEGGLDPSRKHFVRRLFLRAYPPVIFPFPSRAPLPGDPGRAGQVQRGLFEGGAEARRHSLGSATESREGGAGVALHLACCWHHAP